MLCCVFMTTESELAVYSAYKWVEGKNLELKVRILTKYTSLLFVDMLSLLGGGSGFAALEIKELLWPQFPLDWHFNIAIFYQTAHQCAISIATNRKFHPLEKTSRSPRRTPLFIEATYFYPNSSLTHVTLLNIFINLIDIFVNGNIFIAILMGKRCITSSWLQVRKLNSTHTVPSRHT